MKMFCDCKQIQAVDGFKGIASFKNENGVYEKLKTMNEINRKHANT